MGEGIARLYQLMDKGPLRALSLVAALPLWMEQVWRPHLFLELRL